MRLELIGIAIFGILSGGIVNVLADGLPYRQLGRPAYPDGSRRPIRAWLGITAFLFNRRRPPQANEPKLGWRYPITETATAALMVAAYIIMGRTADVSGGQMLIWLIDMAIFMLIAVIDLEHRLIMFAAVIPAGVLALVDAALFPNPLPTLASSLAGGAFGFVIFYLVYQGGYLFRRLVERMRGEKIHTLAFGFGDVMLAGLSGLMIGLPDVILALFISIFLGAIGAVFYLGFGLFAARRYRPYTAIPYGPYIVTATIMVMFFGAELGPLLLGY